MVHLAQLVHLVHVVDLLHLVHLVDLLQMIELIQLLEGGVVVHARLHRGGRCCRRCDMLLVAASRVGVVVDARVSRQLVGSAEAFRAAWELAGVRLLARVSANVSRLVLESVEGLVAQRTLVRSRQVRAMLVLVDRDGWHRHGGASHGRRAGGIGGGGGGCGRRGSRRRRVRRSAWSRGAGGGGLVKLRLLRVQQRAKHVKEEGASLGWRGGR